jgi:hypothetical protein
MMLELDALDQSHFALEVLLDWMPGWWHGDPRDWVNGSLSVQDTIHGWRLRP